MRRAPGRRPTLVGRARTVAVGAATALLLASGAAGTAPAVAYEFDVTVESVEALSGLSAMVARSGDGVNLRAAPDINSEILDTLPDGTIVALRIDQADTVRDDKGIRWWPVRFNSVDGWIAGFYLADARSPAPSAAPSAAATLGLETPFFAAGSYVAAQTDDGSGLNMRAGAGTEFERIGYVSEGDVVQVMGGPEYDATGAGWYLVTNGDVTGYVFAGYLVAAAAAPAAAAEIVLDPVRFTAGDYATAGVPDGVNVRRRASVDARRVGAISAGSVVQIVEGPVYDDSGGGWYLVEGGDLRGYALGTLLTATSAPPPPSGPTGTFIYPLANFVFTQAYGCTGLTTNAYSANLGCYFHNGIDLAAPAYTPIVASDGGVVIAAGWCDCGLGYYVEIDHLNGFTTVYGHMAEQPYVAVGQLVNQGDVIGPVGSTGLSTGPHIHFMLKVNGSTVDPLGYLP